MSVLHKILMNRVYWYITTTTRYVEWLCIAEVSGTYMLYEHNLPHVFQITHCVNVRVHSDRHRHFFGFCAWEACIAVRIDLLESQQTRSQEEKQQHQDMRPKLINAYSQTSRRHFMEFEHTRTQPPTYPPSPPCVQVCMRVTISHTRRPYPSGLSPASTMIPSLARVRKTPLSA